MNPHLRHFLPPVVQLLAFEAAARHGSVSRAAHDLGLTQSAVSRQVHQLEDQLGVALFHRVRQRMVLTDAGRVYAAELRPALQQIATATQQAMACAGSGGVLNLAVLPTFGTRWLVPRMADFADRYPEVTVHFATRTEPFDFASTPFDAAIHFGAPHWAGAECEYLMHEEVVPACSPAYLRAQALHSPADLAVGATLLQQTTRPMQWADWFARAGVDAPQALRGPRFEQFAMMAEAAASGLGVALLPRFLIEAEIAAGRLVVPFGPGLTGGDAYYLVVPESRAQAPLLRTFRDWLVWHASRDPMHRPPVSGPVRLAGVREEAKADAEAEATEAPNEMDAGAAAASPGRPGSLAASAGFIREGGPQAETGAGAGAVRQLSRAVRGSPD